MPVFKITNSVGQAVNGRNTYICGMHDGFQKLFVLNSDGKYILSDIDGYTIKELTYSDGYLYMIDTLNNQLVRFNIIMKEFTNVVSLTNYGIATKLLESNTIDQNIYVGLDNSAVLQITPNGSVKEIVAPGVLQVLDHIACLIGTDNTLLLLDFVNTKYYIINVTDSTPVATLVTSKDLVEVYKYPYRLP